MRRCLKGADAGHMGLFVPSKSLAGFDDKATPCALVIGMLVCLAQRAMFAVYCMLKRYVGGLSG